MFVLIIFTQKTNSVLPASGMPAFFERRIEHADGIAAGQDAEPQRRLAHQAQSSWSSTEFQLGFGLTMGTAGPSLVSRPRCTCRPSRAWTSCQVQSPAWPSVPNSGTSSKARKSR